MDMTIRQGETLQIPIEADDASAVSVRFQVFKGTTVYIDKTENFVNGKATIFTNDTNIAIDEYQYMLTVTYSDGSIDILPDPETCEDGDCTLPTFSVCQGAIGA